MGLIVFKPKMKYLTPEQVYKQFGYHPKTTAEWSDLGKKKIAEEQNIYEPNISQCDSIEDSESRP